MFWQEDEGEKDFPISDAVVDVLFALKGKRIPVDHAYALSQAIQAQVPWLTACPEAGIHSIHVAGSQNGWERPAHAPDQYLILSRRTKLRIRIPREQLDRLRTDLEGKTLDLAGCSLRIGEGHRRSLDQARTLFSRHVVMKPQQPEAQFLREMVGLLRAMKIPVRKALCGKETLLTTPDGPLPTRSLMLADLSPEESIRLQQQGLGSHREMGCGLFIPHKGIDPVVKKNP